MKHPKPVRIIELANYIGKTRHRSARILDYLSGDCGMETVTDFLIYCNDDENPVTYNIFKDVDTGIYP